MSKNQIISIILECLFIFSPAEANAERQSRTMNLLYDSAEKDVILSDIGVSVEAVFFALFKSGKISMKHTYRVYADQYYYYFVDTFWGVPKNDHDVRRRAVRIRRDRKLTESDIKAE